MAIYLDGNSHFKTSENPQWEGIDKASWSFWHKPDANLGTDGKGVWGNGTAWGDNCCWRFMFWSDGNFYGQIGNAAGNGVLQNIYTIAGNWFVGEWNHTVITFDKDATPNMRVYNNGKEITGATQNENVALHNSNSGVVIGQCEITDGYPFDGFLAEYVMWKNIVLTAEERALLGAAIKGICGRIHVDKILCYYPMDELRDGEIYVGNDVLRNKQRDITYCDGAGCCDMDVAAGTPTGAADPPENPSPTTVILQNGLAINDWLIYQGCEDSCPYQHNGGAFKDCNRGHNPSITETGVDCAGHSGLFCVNAYVVNYAHRGLMKFDLDCLCLPKNCIIDSAILSLYFAGNWTNAYNVNISAHRILKEWGEGNKCLTACDTGECCWTYAKWNTVAWSGCAPDDVDAVSIPEDTITINNVLGWKNWDLTDVVRGWIWDDYKNYGVVLKGPETATSVKKFYGSENIVIPARRPILTINYHVVPSNYHLKIDNHIKIGNHIKIK